MKKMYLLSLLILLVLASCKDKAVPVPISEQILGKWTETTVINYYYDENNKELYKDVIFALSTEYYFEADLFNTSIGLGSNYSLTEGNGKYYIVIEGRPIERWEIKIAGDVMTWYGKNPQPSYYDPITQTMKPAHHEIIKVEFRRLK